MPSRSAWYGDHPAYCTCKRCQDAKDDDTPKKRRKPIWARPQETVDQHTDPATTRSNWHADHLSYCSCVRCEVARTASTAQAAQGGDKHLRRRPPSPKPEVEPQVNPPRPHGAPRHRPTPRHTRPTPPAVECTPIRRPYRRPRTPRLPIGKIFLVVAALFIGVFALWPVDSYGEGLFWEIKSFSDHATSRTPEDRAFASLSYEEKQAVYDQEHLEEMKVVEHHIHYLVNEERRVGKMDPLEYDEDIADIARGHSEAMMAAREVSHELNGERANDRMQRAGYKCTKTYTPYLSENVAYLKGYRASPKAIALTFVQNWLNSPGHRANMLDRSHVRMGVGVAHDGGDRWYATQNFSSCETREMD